MSPALQPVCFHQVAHRLALRGLFAEHPPDRCRAPGSFYVTPVGFEPTQLALAELESTPLDHSGKVSSRVLFLRAMQRLPMKSGHDKSELMSSAEKRIK